MEVSRAGFIHRGANLFDSLTLSIREEKKTKVFKASVKKWVKENKGFNPIDKHVVWFMNERLITTFFRNLDAG